MFPLSPTAYKYIAIALFIGVAALGWKMYWSEHTKLITFKAQVEQVGKDQKAASDKQDQQAKENAREAQQSTAKSAKSIHNWGITHPARVFDSASCGKLPEAAGNPKGTGQAGGLEIPATQYVSPYTPEETELLANQLDKLLQMLHNDGAKFEH